ncbi:MAG TPA: hypothetical protein VFO65_07065, partial [Acidimicrobiales bacterium]|nr:hypothetical protein [Acidimicrobiales bacterium]
MTAAIQSVQPDHWFYVGWPYVMYGAIVLVLLARGEHGDLRNPVRIFFRRISWSLERATGYPGWAMAGVLTGLHSLGVAVFGLYWDVAFHIDTGRDQSLFTPSHTMILLGLGGLFFAAAIAIIFATNDDAPVGLRALGARVPWSAVVLAALGFGGVAAFPLDNLWHEAYGIDVTLWSPTHLQLVAGGSLAPIALWLMLREANREAEPTLLGHGIHALLLGAVLAGMSTFMGEFDFGVPQFQVGYFPLLVGVAAGFSLVFARLAFGPGGALVTAVIFVVLRGLIVVGVSGALNHTVPRFPLFLVAAGVVELVALALGTEKGLRFAALAGVGVGTVGVAAELVWASASGWFGGAVRPLPAVVYLLVPIASVAAAVLGAALAGRAAVGLRIPALALAGSVAALLVTMAIPLPREVGEVSATITLQPAEDGRAVVEVDLEPHDAAHDATAFGVVSWQGGGRVSASFEETEEGYFVSSQAVPVEGRWKSMIGLQRGDEVMAAPVYLPADPEIGAEEIPALPVRDATFVRNTELLLRESKPGPAWPALAAYAGVAVVAAMWLGLFGLCAVKLDDAA